MLVIRPALVIFTTSEFNQAYKYAPLLILAVVFTCFSTFTGSVYVASKKSVRSMFTALTGAILNIILNLILIPLWGLNGAAFATFISYMLIFTVRAVDTRKIVRIDLKLPKMITNIIIITIMGAIIMTVKNDVIYYTGLSLLFTASVVVNFRSGIKAIQMILKKKG